MKKYLLFSLLAFGFLTFTLLANDSQFDSNKVFAGTWEIDLRPTPDSQPYLKSFVVKIEKDGTFSGSFYDTPFKDGRINNLFGEFNFAFITVGGDTTYYHSGRIVNGEVRGLTHAPNRKLLSVWSGKKKSRE